MRLGQEADLVVVAPATADLLARAAARPRRRPADHHPAHRPLPGRLRPGDAHRDVAAPRHPGQRRHAARARRPRARARRRPADRRRHRPGPAARARGDLRAAPSTCSPRAGAPHVARPRRAARRGLRRRHPRVLDPVRFLGNRSSGKQGYALARAAAARGAEVTLVAANVAPARPGRRQGASGSCPRAELRDAVLARPRRGADAVVMAAAPADFRPAARRRHQDQEGAPTAAAPTIELVAEPRHPGRAGRPTARPAASTGRGRLRRRDRRRRPAPCSTTPAPSSPARAATCWSSTTSAAAQVFGADDNEAVILGADGRESPVPRGSKAALAHVDLGPGRRARSRQAERRP